MRFTASLPRTACRLVPPRAKSCLFLPCAVLLSALVIAQQAVAPPPGAQDTAPPPPATALILGQAVDGTSGKPLSGVTVTLTSAAPAARGAAGPPPPPPRVLADGDGRFVFHDLKSGAYNITATKSGFAAGAYGKSSANGGGRLLTLNDGERRGNVTVALWRFAIIGGRVVDDAGEPVIGLPVKVMRRTIAAGHRYFSPLGNQKTDDRGIYRASGLTPGDYIVAIPMTQATVSTSFADAMDVARKNGTLGDFQRAMDATGATSLANSMPGTSGVRMGDVSFEPGGPARPLSPDATKLFVYPTMFYPAASTPAEATVVTVGSGEEKLTVDFQLRPVAAVRVSGTVTGPSGGLPHIGLRLLASWAGALLSDGGFEVATTVSDGNGAFTFLGVPTGSYRLDALTLPPEPVSTGSSLSIIQVGSSTIYSGGGGGASAPPPIPDEPTLWADVPVLVGDSDVTDVSVSLRPGFRVSGHLEFAGAAAKPAPDRLRLMSLYIDPVDGRFDFVAATNGRTRGVVDTDGQFNTYQLPAGRYVIRPGTLPGWTIKSAIYGGKDVVDTPLELDKDATGVVITYTDHPTELSGTVRDAHGGADPSAMVVMFPADSKAWMDYSTVAGRRVKNLRAQKDGTFKLPGVPAGSYFLAAVPDDTTNEWTDPAFLQQLQRVAVAVTIGDGEKKTQDLTTSLIK